MKLAIFYFHERIWLKILSKEATTNKELIYKSISWRVLATTTTFIISGIVLNAFDEVALYMNIANILVSTRTIGNNPPLKIYDYLGAGKPIVATNIDAHMQILNDDIAVLVDPGPEFIAEGIISLIDNPSYAKTLGQRSRDFFENNYSTQEKIERTRQILNVVMREDI